VIFVTVGAQMPFDRLIRWADAWAGSQGRSDVVAQIGPSAFAPLHLRATQFLDPPEFRRQMREAQAIVSHAGVGTILDALALGRPLLVVPRLGRLAETRNDHQVATAQRFAAEGLVRAAYSEAQFAEEMQRLGSAAARPGSARGAEPRLLARIREYARAAAPR